MSAAAQTRLRSESEPVGAPSSGPTGRWPSPPLDRFLSASLCGHSATLRPHSFLFPFSLKTRMLMGHKRFSMSQPQDEDNEVRVFHRGLIRPTPWSDVTLIYWRTLLFPNITSTVNHLPGWLCFLICVCHVKQNFSPTGTSRGGNCYRAELMLGA